MRIPDLEILQVLQDDTLLKLKEKTKTLREGICPECGRKAVWINKEKPWVLRCDHEGTCGYSETVKERYPNLFENFAKRFPANDKDPKATARAYMQIERGFPAAISEWYEQGAYKIENGPWVETVKFWLFGSKDWYWERIIDRAHVRQAGKKARFKYGIEYGGKHWEPHKQEINPKRRVFIVEGIFHCIAMHLAEYQAVAAFSSSNLPRELIEAHKGRGITWVLAYDDEPGARKHVGKYKKELEAKGEKVEVALTGDSSQDWDDLYKAKRLNDDTIKQCLWRGRVFSAETPGEKALVLHAWRKRHYLVYDHRNRLYSARVNSDSLVKALEGEDFNWEKHLKEFLSATVIESISNFYPEFLYAQVDDILDERRYVFRVSYCNGNPQGLVELEGSNIDTPSNFHKAMLNNSLGGTFDGQAKDLKILRDRWLNQRITVVKSIPFLGYEPESKVYVYGDFGFYQGRALKLNKEGYLEAAGKGIRTSFKGFRIHRGEHNTDWLDDFLTVFHWQGLTTLAFWLGSLFVQQIRARDKSFPFLEVTGEPGAGKSTLLEFCWKLLGRENHEGFDPNKSSAAGRRRAFGQGSNMPCVLIESDHGDGDQKRGRFDFDELKPLFDGRGLGTLGVAKRGNDTEEPLFQGALVIAQNDTVEGSEAVIQRIVHCHCTRDHHTRESEQVAKWFNQTGTERLAGFLPAALGKEKEILATYEKALNHYRNKFYDRGGIRANLGRLIQNHAQIMACAVSLKHIIPELRDETLRDLETYIYDRALDRQARVAKDHPLIERFWEMFEYMNLQRDSGAFGGEAHIEALNHSVNKEFEIAINFAQFDEMARKHGQQPLEMARVKKLLAHSTRYPFVEQRKVKSPTLNKTLHCWVFKKGKAA